MDHLGSLHSVSAFFFFFDPVYCLHVGLSILLHHSFFIYCYSLPLIYCYSLPLIYCYSLPEGRRPIYLCVFLVSKLSWLFSREVREGWGRVLLQKCDAICVKTGQGQPKGRHSYPKSQGAQFLWVSTSNFSLIALGDSWHSELYQSYRSPAGWVNFRFGVLICGGCFSCANFSFTVRPIHPLEPLVVRFIWYVHLRIFNPSWCNGQGEAWGPLWRSLEAWGRVNECPKTGVDSTKPQGRNKSESDRKPEKSGM